MLAIPMLANAQKAWMTPDPINPDDSVTIWVDIKQCDCKRLLGSTEPLYFWTWMPRELPASDPLSNGTWLASNEALKMTSAGNDIWFFKMVPTKFYGVTSGTIYDKDFSFLIKKKDGTGAGGGGCNEDKTEDLKISIDPPKQGPQKVKPFPALAVKDTLSTSWNDVFTLIYDNQLEEKDSLEGKSDFYVFVQGLGDNGTTYTITPITQVGNNPKLAMQSIGSQKFDFQTIPSQLFEGIVPAGVKLRYLRFQIVRKKISSSDDTVDGVYIYWFNNTCE